MYVNRNESGDIVATYAMPQRKGHEFIEGATVAPSIDQKIAELEAQVTSRNLRGAALGDQYAIDHIQSIENQINDLRGSL